MRRRIIIAVLASLGAFILIFGSFQLYGLTQNSKKGQLSEIEIGNVTNTNPIKDSGTTGEEGTEITSSSEEDPSLDPVAFDKDEFNEKMTPTIKKLTEGLNTKDLNKSFDTKVISDETFMQLKTMIAGDADVKIQSFNLKDASQVADSAQAIYDVVYKKGDKTLKLKISMLVDLKTHAIETVSKGE